MMDTIGAIVFEDIAVKAGLATWSHRMGTHDKQYILETIGSGVALPDFDGDGWPDIFVSNFGADRLYRNNHNGTFTDVAVKAGVTLGNCSAGATWATTTGTAGYASSPDQRPHFGLGSATMIQAVEVHWPDGTVQRIKPPAAVDRFYRIVEGGEAMPVP